MQHFYIVRVESGTLNWRIVFQTGNLLEAVDSLKRVCERQPELTFKILVELEA